VTAIAAMITNKKMDLVVIATTTVAITVTAAVIVTSTAIAATIHVTMVSTAGIVKFAMDSTKKTPCNGDFFTQDSRGGLAYAG
jgi:hypothetical protein